MTRRALMLTLCGAPAATLIFAQGPPRGQGGRGGGMGGGRMLEQMKETLKLSDEQMEKLKPIFDANQEKSRELFEKFRDQERTDETRQAMRAERGKLQEEMNKKVGEVLTKEQMTGYEKMLEEMPGRGGGGRRGGPPRQ